MSEPNVPEPVAGDLPRAESQSALFAQLVLQQTNLALMLLGKVPNPQSGETRRDLDGARLFIDQLEMLEAKTRGNLAREEARLLQQSLMTLRLAFVEAVDASAPAAGGAADVSSAAAGEPKAAPADDAGATEESRKRFSKKY